MTSSVEGRLHPFAAVIFGWRIARGAVPASIAAIVALDMSVARVAALAAILVAVAAPVAVLWWWRYHYRVVDGRLEVTRGVLVRRERTVPLERIRGVALDEPIVHRALGLVRVRVDAAAAGDVFGELALAAVGRQAGNDLRDAVLGSRAMEPERVAEPTGAVLAAPSVAMLLLAGATSPRYLLIPGGLIFGVLNPLADDFGLDWLTGWLTDTFLDATPEGVAARILLGGCVVVVAVALAALGSVIADGGFRLRSDSGRLRTDRGLISHRQTVVERRRVLGVETLDSPWRRALGVASLVAPVGGVSAAAGESGGQVRLVPLDRRQRIEELNAHLTPDEPELEPHPKAALPRRLVRAVAIPAGALVVGVSLDHSWLAVIAAISAVAMVGVAVDRHRSLGHGVGRWLVLRSGSLARRRSVLDPAAPVTYVLRRSPSQRRAGLCTVQAHLGLGAGTRSALDIGHDQARRLITQLAPWVGLPADRR